MILVAPGTYSFEFFSSSSLSHSSGFPKSSGHLDRLQVLNIEIDSTTDHDNN